MFGNLIKFAKDAGAKIGFGKDKDEDAKNLKNEMKKHGFKTDDVDVAVEGDKVVLTGKALTQEEREKLILVAGNVEGVDSVEDKMEILPTRTHTVKSGDTLSKIAKDMYGDAMKYPVIFEANKPMLSHPDKIYPGQVLRIPALDAQA